MSRAKINNNNYDIEFESSNLINGFINHDDFNLEIKDNEGTSFKVLKNNIEFEIDIISFNAETKKVNLLVNGKPFDIEIEDEFDILVKKLGLKKKSNSTEKEIKAQMPGLVLEIYTNKGDKVTKGQKLITLEAMKMENVIKANSDGIIKSIKVEQGMTVEKGDIIFELE